MLTRRNFVQSTVLGALLGSTAARAFAQDRFDQDALFDFYPLGTITLIHIGDLHGQITPHYRRPPEHRSLQAPQEVPNLAGEAFRIRYGIGGATPMDYAHTHENFQTMAEIYGPIGGLDRVATTVNAIRASRTGALLLSGRAFWQGPIDGRAVLAALRPDFVADGSAPSVVFERAGVQLAVISSTARTKQEINRLQSEINVAREAGARIVICQSGNDVAADLALAAQVTGLDILLSSGAHDALPEPEVVSDTYVIASGTQARFVSRVDIELGDGQTMEISHKLIPMFSDLIAPDPAVAEVVRNLRKPHRAALEEVIGQADTLLFKRGVLGSTWDDVILAALIQEFDADIAFSQGTRAGRSLLFGQAITREDIWALCAGDRARCENQEMTGAEIVGLLERAASQAFHSDPMQRRGQDMLRAGGLQFVLEPDGPEGKRISNLKQLPGGAPIEPAQNYKIAAWSLSPRVDAGPPLSAVLARYIAARGRVGGARPGKVTLKK